MPTQLVRHILELNFYKLTINLILNKVLPNILCFEPKVPFLTIKKKVTRLYVQYSHIRKVSGDCPEKYIFYWNIKTTLVWQNWHKAQKTLWAFSVSHPTEQNSIYFYFSHFRSDVSDQGPRKSNGSHPLNIFRGTFGIKVAKIRKWFLLRELVSQPRNC